MAVSCLYMKALFILCFGQQVPTTRQMSLANRHFKIGATAWPPLLAIGKNDKGEDTIYGPVGEYLKYLEQARNCSFTIVIPTDKKWGHCNGSANCTGVIGLVAKKEVDFAINPFTQTTDRKEAVDFTRPVLYANYYAVVIPVKPKTKMWYFIYPFTPKLWFMYIISIPVCLIAIGLADYFCNGFSNLDAIASFVLRIALIEHSPRYLGLAKRYQQKLAVIVLVSCFMVLTYSYCGNMTAMLTKTQLQSPIRTLSELLIQSEIPWVIESGGFVETLMSKAPPGSLTNKLYERSKIMPLKVASSGCYSTEVEEDGTYGAICSIDDFKTLTAKYFSRTEKCNYYFVEQKFLHSWAALAIQVRHSGFAKGLRGPYLDEIYPDSPNAEKQLQPALADYADQTAQSCNLITINYLSTLGLGGAYLKSTKV